MFQKAVELAENADILIIVCTFIQVYPAAALHLNNAPIIL
jgi:NAD-dependent SIR2 family protein deacetylase